MEATSVSDKLPIWSACVPEIYYFSLITVKTEIVYIITHVNTRHLFVHIISLMTGRLNESKQFIHVKQNYPVTYIDTISCFGGRDKISKYKTSSTTKKT